MKNSLFVSALLGYQCAVEAQTLGRTLTDCRAFAAKFDNTCDPNGSPIDMTVNADNETMSCTGIMACPGSTS